MEGGVSAVAFLSVRVYFSPSSIRLLLGVIKNPLRVFQTRETKYKPAEVGRWRHERNRRGGYARYNERPSSSLGWERIVIPGTYVSYLPSACFSFLSLSFPFFSQENDITRAQCYS